MRVDNLGQVGVEIKILGETFPLVQWDVTGELRLRIKKEFEKEGIEIPFPTTRVLIEARENTKKTAKHPEDD